MIKNVISAVNIYNFEIYTIMDLDSKMEIFLQ